MAIKYLTFILFFLLSGCFFKPDKVEVIGLDRKKPRQSRAEVIEVNIINNQLVLKGTHLDEVKSLKIKGPASFDEAFSIESKTSNTLIANGLKNINFVLNGIFSLVINDAHGASSYQITFTLQEGSVTASKLSDMGAGIGQVLRFNGTSWEPADLSSLTYAGNWNATTNSPDLNAGGNLGEYYIVQVGGSHDLIGGAGTDNWSVGDWVVWNEVVGQWEKINNATNVTSFNGRNGPVTPQVGDYTWSEIDKTISSIDDITDVSTLGATVGQVLKWNGTEWAPSNDLSSGGAGSVTSTEIANGTIIDANISAGAAIAQSKISGLTTALAGKVSLSGDTMTGNLNMGANNIITTGLVDGVDVSTLATQVTTGLSGKENTIVAGTALQYWRGDKTWQTLNSDIVPEGATNLYYTSARARADVIVDSIVDGVTDRAPSQNAVFDALALKADAIGYSPVNNAGDTMTGTLNLPSNGLIAGTDQFVLVDGNVGIGTAVPKAKAHIESVGAAGVGLITAVSGTRDFTISTSVTLNRGDHLVSSSGSRFIVEDGGTGTSFKAILGTSSSITDETYTRYPALLNVGETISVSGLGDTHIASEESGSVLMTKYNDTPSVAPSFIARRSRGTRAAATATQTGDTIFGIFGRGHGASDWGSTVGSFRIMAAENYTDTAQGSYIDFGTTAIGTTTRSTRMRIAADGRIGVGLAISNQEALMHIRQTGSNALQIPLLIQNNDVTNGGSATAIGFKVATASSNIKSAIAYERTAAFGLGKLHFLMNTVADTSSVALPDSKMTILSNGFVGIGTTDPTTSLEVAGTIKATAFEGPMTSTVTSSGAGTNALPSMTFSDDTDTGFYNTSSNNTISVSTGGSRIFDFTSNGLASSTNGGALITSGNGVEATPTYSFAGDPDTGWFSPGANTLAASTAGTEKIRITSTGYVGIGTPSPQKSLHVRSDGAFQMRLQNGNAGGGFWNIGQSDNIFGAGGGKLLFVPDTDNSASATVAFTNNGRVGIGTVNPTQQLHVYSTSITGSNVRIESGDTGGRSFTLKSTGSDTLPEGAGHFSIIDNNAARVRFKIAPSGNIGIGTTNPDELLVVDNGTTVGKYTTGGWDHSSDIRLKHDILPLENSLEKILKIEGVQYKFNSDPNQETQLGFIAQKVEPIFPEVVHTDKKGYKSMVYSNLIAPLVEAVKTIYERLYHVEREIASVKNDQFDLNARVEQLEVENQIKDQKILELEQRLEKLERSLETN